MTLLYQIVCEIWSEKFNYSYKIKTSSDHFHVDSFKRKDLRRFQGFWYQIACRASYYLSEIVILYTLPRSIFYIIDSQYFVFCGFEDTYCYIIRHFVLKIYDLLLKGFKIRTSVSDKISLTIQRTLCVAIHKMEYHELIFWCSCSHIVNVCFFPISRGYHHLRVHKKGLEEKQAIWRTFLTHKDN